MLTFLRSHFLWSIMQIQHNLLLLALQCVGFGEQFFRSWFMVACMFLWSLLKRLKYHQFIMSNRLFQEKDHMWIGVAWHLLALNSFAELNLITTCISIWNRSWTVMSITALLEGWRLCKFYMNIFSSQECMWD